MRVRQCQGATPYTRAERRTRTGDTYVRDCQASRLRCTFIQATSNVPFAAIAAGRDQLRPALREIGILRPVIAIAAYALFFVFHGRLFGAPSFEPGAVAGVGTSVSLPRLRTGPDGASLGNSVGPRFEARFCPSGPNGLAPSGADRGYPPTLRRGS